MKLLVIFYVFDASLVTIVGVSQEYCTKTPHNFRIAADRPTMSTELSKGLHRLYVSYVYLQ